MDEEERTTKAHLTP